MRWIRLLWALVRARHRDQLSVHQSSVLFFRVWITDVDAAIMNHAAMLTIMEMGRIDLMVRSGFWKLARKSRWYFVSAGVNAQFIRPLKAFQKAKLVTRVFHVDDPWIYIEQKIIRQDKLIAVCMVKSKVKKDRENISTAHIAALLETGPFPTEAPELVLRYEEVNRAAADRSA